MKNKIKFKIKAVAPRLSDEDPDPIEQDDGDSATNQMIEGWLPWDPDDIIDVRRLIEERMEPKQRAIVEAFLDGQTYTMVGVTEKYWRYHFTKGIEFIKRELKL
jgi:hypothetical protein